ncbi:MAG: hypothetical protein IPJ66_06240 [Bacteroidetes bacterium]|nr:hypothetical protein [Bacteroidota bacterium]
MSRFADLGEYMPDTNQTLIPFPGSCKNLRIHPTPCLPPVYSDNTETLDAEISQASSILEWFGRETITSTKDVTGKVENARLPQQLQNTPSIHASDAFPLTPKLDPGQVLWLPLNIL